MTLLKDGGRQISGKDSTIASVLKEARKLAIPSSIESKKLMKKTESIKKKLETEISRQKIKAGVFVGGSFAKDTWLKNSDEVDIFIRFDLKHDSISELLKSVLEKCFKKIVIIKGSREYYQADGFEFIPIYNIRRHIDARNITDFSPLHVKFMKENLTEEMKNEVRLLKLFCKSNGFYGAETHLHAFSGYVLELLIVAYGSFTHLLREMIKKTPKIHIDFGVKHDLSEHKVKSPIIIHDPTQSERNAAAALNYKTFYDFVFTARKFLESPSVSFFKKKRITVSSLQKISERRGTKFFSKKIKAKSEAEGFSVYDHGYVESKNSVDAYFEFSTLKTSKMKRHYGPPVQSDHYHHFIEKWGDKVYLQEGRLCVDIPRVQSPEKYVSKLLDDI